MPKVSGSPCNCGCVLLLWEISNGPLRRWTFGEFLRFPLLLKHENPEGEEEVQVTVICCPRFMCVFMYRKVGIFHRSDFTSPPPPPPPGKILPPAMINSW